MRGWHRRSALWNRGLAWPGLTNLSFCVLAQAQKMIALGEVQPNCQRLALIGDTFNLPAMLKSLRCDT